MCYTCTSSNAPFRVDSITPVHNNNTMLNTVVLALCKCNTFVYEVILTVSICYMQSVFTLYNVCYQRYLSL